MTGLADALIMLGLRYDDVTALEVAADAMRSICLAAYRTSIALAREKGSFPFFDRRRYLEGRFIASLPEDIQDGIARDGIRNSHLMAIAPAGRSVCSPTTYRAGSSRRSPGPMSAEC